MAGCLGIEILFLPASSPNLNLIESLWKLVKKCCLKAKYFRDFTDFRGAIDNCLSDLATVSKADTAAQSSF